MSIKLNAQSGGSVALDAPTQTTSSADLTFKLPVADGSAGQILTTDGSGNLSWANDTGKILQVNQTVKTDVYNVDVLAGSISGDIPGLTVSITPTNASNKILVSVALTCSFQDSTPTRMGITLYKGGSVISGAIGDSDSSKPNLQRVTFGQEIANAYTSNTICGEYLDTAGSTNATTYSVRISHGHSSDKAVFVNRCSTSHESNHNYHMRHISTITVKEIAV